jgi:SAM-dependent methyltransferase
MTNPVTTSAAAAILEGPNREQVTYWSEVAGPKWVSLERHLEAQIGAIGRMAIDRLALERGERVIDVGCGCGGTSLHIAERVGSEGFVLGVDVSQPMLAIAEQRRREAQAQSVRFVHGDVQIHPFEPRSFDAVFSRFGIMFFADPLAAFRNLVATLRPGGRIGFAAWQGIDRNPWMMVPMRALAGVIPLPPAPDPHGPGPFAFADAERVCAILEAAGFVEAEAEPLATTMSLGGAKTVEEAVDFLLEVGAAATALREAGEEVRPRARRAMADALAPYATPSGVAIDGAAWIFTARVSGGGSGRESC